MAVFVLMLLLLAMAAPSSASWCICKEGNEAALQKALDYACGAGADCGPTHQSGPCYNPNTVRAHCSYAVNSYFQKYKQNPQACDFSGAATIVTSDPSTTGCAYPATASSTSPVSGTTSGGTSGTSASGGTTTVGGGTTGVLGGTNNGLGPSGFNNDLSFGIFLIPKPIVTCLSMILAFFALLP